MARRPGTKYEKMRDNKDFRRKTRINALRQEARKRELEVSVDFTKIEEPTHCPLLGIEIDYINGSCYVDSPSYDRIDSSKGYVDGNVMIISGKANCMKRDATREELLLFAKNIQKYLDRG